MKNKELIEHLQAFDPELEVKVCAYIYKSDEVVQRNYVIRDVLEEFSTNGSYIEIGVYNKKSEKEFLS